MNTPHLRLASPLHRLAAAALLAIAMQAALAQSHAFTLPAQPLDQALAQFARQAKLQLAASAELLRGLRSQPVSGTLDVKAALAELLRGSGLQGRINDGLLTIERGAPRTEAETTLPTVRVKASAERESATGPVSGHVARRSAAGTKTDTPIADTPQSISVIGAQELEDKGSTTLPEALAQTPGVAVNMFGFDSRAPDWVLLRGFDGWYTSSYRDGLVQNVGITFLGVQTEVYGLERIEVVRGPSSVLFGKGDAGGVVNRVSKTPRADAVNEFGLQLGSHGRKQVMADLGGALDSGGQWLWRLVGLGLDTGTQERYPHGVRMEQQRQYLAPSLRWQPTAQTSLTLQAEVLRDDASDDVQYVTGADGQPTRVKEGDPSFSRIRTESDAVGYQFDHRLDGAWRLQQKLRYAERRMDKHHILSWLADATTLERQARHDVESVKELAVDTSVQGTLRTGGIKHTLLLGLDWDRSRASWQRWRDMSSSLDLSRPVYGIPIAEPSTQAADTQQDSTQLGLYAQDQIQLGEPWRLTLGTRRDRVKSVNDDRFYAQRSEQTDNATSSRVGVSYAIGNGWAPYASYAESFVPNVGVDGTGRAFKASRGRQVELGAKYMPDSMPVSFAVAAFSLEKDNVVSYDPSSYEPRQIGKLRSRGLELEAKAELSRQLRMTASFTALDMSILSSANPAEVGNMPILTPRQTGSLWFDYQMGEGALRGLGVGGGVRYVGKRWNDEANTSSEPAYALVDTAVHYDTGRWRVALHITNLFDRHYYAGRAYGSHFVGAERNVVLTAKYRF
ncbi:TonB-dependent siderophore receptor [Aquabacterium sp.]|uniref:TonB-dependent siderophore receptor n=1 Tax=Aquabacterium sp. TaxID=1872578 RepID=UPI002CD8A1CD|nr:TonB-dependent siderophore receptor [Aquabacterium sp.]HSW05078.1 TonB-dependent siderophore receptor [Aquabacterium sp.]